MSADRENNLWGLAMAVQCERCGMGTLVEAVFVHKRRSFRRSSIWLCPNCAVRRSHRADVGWTLVLLASLVGLFVLEADSRWLFANLALFLLMSYLSLVPHELGHAGVGRLVGMRVLRVVFGTGRRRFQWRAANVVWQVNTWPTGGLTCLGRGPERGLTLRMAVTVAAGPAANAAMLGLALWFCSPTQMYELGVREAAAPWTAMALANLLTGVSNLWPRHVREGMLVIPSDGRWLLDLLLHRSAAARQACLVRLEMAEVYELYLEGQWQEALALLEQLRDRIGHGEDVALENFYGVLLIGAGQFAAARVVFEALGEREDLDELFRGVVLNNVAYALIGGGSRDDLPRAEATARAASERVGWLVEVRGTLAAAQLLMGDPEQAEAALKEVMAGHVQPANRAVTMVFLALAARWRGDEEQAAALTASALAVGGQRPEISVLLGRLDEWEAAGRVRPAAAPASADEGEAGVAET